MPDDIQSVGVDDSLPETGIDPKWIQGIQDALDGKTSTWNPKQGIPPGYKIDNGKIVQQNGWDEWGKGATEFFGSAIPTILTAGTTGPLGAAGSAGAEGGKMSTLSSILDLVDKGSNIYSGLSDVLGGAAKSSNAQNNISDQLKLALYGAQNPAALNAKKFASAAPGARMSTAFSSVLPNYATKTKVNWGGPGSGLRGEVPTFSGGPLDSTMAAGKDPGYSKLRDQVLQDELVSQMKGGASGGNEDAQTTTAPQIGDTSALDKGLGAGSLTTGILGALSLLKKKNPNAMTPGQPWAPPTEALDY